MRYVVRNWTCRNCGRANQTMAGLDGTVKCEHCADSLRIPPGKTLDGDVFETAGIEPPAVVERGGKSEISCGGLPGHRDVERRAAFVELREHYVKARRHGSSNGRHQNLEWILGASRNSSQDPPGFEAKTIEVVALWLQDLVAELDRRLPKPLPEKLEEDAVSAFETRQVAAQNLRDATKRFLAAFSQAKCCDA